jgi:hypothetical protein
MCIDYPSINKGCPKDPFPLPQIDQIVDSTYGCDLIRDLVEVYVDDIVVKIKSHSSLLDNLTIVFDRLCLTCTMLNTDKCVFKVSTGKVLGFLVLHRGIKDNLEKIKAIEEMRPPAQMKDVQKLMGCLVALSRFMSRLAEWTLPFFKLMWKSGLFVWTKEADEAFQELEQYLMTVPVMVAP